jgi:DNA repair photolyase
MKAQKPTGRATFRNEASRRFGLPERVADEDWLEVKETIDGSTPVRTTVTIEHARKIISYNQSPDVRFDRSINPYRGCEHGCIYCFARPTHAYLDLSPGLDFESRLFAKPDAALLLRNELAKPGYVPAPIGLGTNTDPYQPIEDRFRITRSCLEVLAETRHPVRITTKSNRVLRDIDLLAAMAEMELVSVSVSITSLNAKIARRIEPRAPHPAKRLEAVRKLAAAGIPTYVSIAPVIPGITDHEIEDLVAAAADAGAGNVSYIPIRLPYEVAPLFKDWLESQFPDRAKKVMTIIRSLRGGKDNDPNFHSRLRGEGPWAELLQARIAMARRRHGMGSKASRIRIDLFEPPILPGAQLRLL